MPEDFGKLVGGDFRKSDPPLTTMVSHDVELMPIFRANQRLDGGDALRFAMADHIAQYVR